MKYLTKSEISVWHSQNSTPIDPYKEVDDGQLFYVQFIQPTEHLNKEAFAHSVIELMITQAPSLFLFHDWDSYTKSQMLAIDALRNLDGEKRTLIESPARLLDKDEKDLAISLLSLTSSFGWSSSLHCPVGKTSLHNWEGEIYDFWTESKPTMDLMLDLIDQFNLKIT